MCIGSLDHFFVPLPKFCAYEGNVELLLKSIAKAYSVKDLSAIEATKGMVKAASGYDQIEQSTMVKQNVNQGEVIINKLNQVIVGIERVEKLLGGGAGGGSGGGRRGGGGEGGGGSSGGSGGEDGGGNDGGDGRDGVDFTSHLDFDPL